MDKFSKFTTKGNQKIDEICRKAAVIFSTKGYLVAKLDDVAIAANITKGGLYHYFRSKDELLFLVLSRYVDRILDGVKEEPEAFLGPSERIRFLIHRQITLFHENIHESRILGRDVVHLSKERWHRRGKRR